MFPRLINPSKTNSFFIFGARGTGKSTYLRSHFSGNHFINLLQDEWESRYLSRPDRLIEDLKALPVRPDWIIIDEVQKIPKLLDTVHHLIEAEKYRFILTGSSARKLKRGQANLLAGRAFHYELFPLTFNELGKDFELSAVLKWGSLPTIFRLTEADRAEYLRAYATTYLREEVLQEQIVRNGAAFRQFLEVAAQENGNSLNFTKIGRDVGIDTKTAQSYFHILEDTLIGFFLPAFHHSARKSAGHQPKFYLFDLGVKRALEGNLREDILPRTFGYGRAFEHFFITECYRLNRYLKTDYRLYHFKSTAGGEIDLILHRGKETIAIEIKSTDRVDELEARKLGRISEGVGATRKVYISQDPVTSEIDGVSCEHWEYFLKNIFNLNE